MRDNRRFGAGGEGYAAAYLQKAGYEILAENFTCVYGEIDIIARKGGVIAFIEVKARLSDKYGRPAEAVTRKKQHHISMAAASYIKANKLFVPDIRFDVIEVFVGEINHIEDAFYSTMKGF